MSVFNSKKILCLRMATLSFAAIWLITLFFALPIDAENSIQAIKGQTFYTQFSLYYEKNCYRTTNYRKGVLVPINTEVKFIRVSGESIFITLPNRRTLEIANIKKYSGEEIDKIFSRSFALNPVDLSVFTNDEQKSILAGEVQLGMRKSAVIAALGYPPEHKTPTLESNQWQYWSNRFNTFIVCFENGKVSQVQD